MKELTRREVLVFGAAAAVAASVGPAFGETAIEAITGFTGGLVPEAGGVRLVTPPLAENGNAVDVEIDAPGATAVRIIAPDNPYPTVATFNFGPMSGSGRVATRIRLARSQTIMVVAKMADGSVRKAEAAVEVTVAGCGG